MDDIDHLQKRDEILMAAQLAQRKSVLPHRGSCYFCMEPVAALYCDNDCRDDHQKEVHMATPGRTL